MRKKTLSEFGISIKRELIEIGQTQEWLMQKARDKTSMYIDCSNLYKIMTGQINSPKIELAIREILGLKSA